MTPLRSLVSRIARGAAIGLGGTVVAGGTAVTAYACTERGLGLRREVRFWGGVAPIVVDYWWHASSSSPLVRFRKRFGSSEKNGESGGGETDGTEEESDSSSSSSSDDVFGDEDETGTRSTTFRKLHERNAPRIYSIMIELGGLYIKLGQVLSVTALPVPKQYRELFRTLQSGVPGHEEFVGVVRPTLEAELGRPLEEVFESIEEIPCGAASIGQAHRARLVRGGGETGNEDRDEDEDNGGSRDVVIKVQYPDAKWQVPADVKCVGDFLDLCVYFGVVDESSAKLSYEEFSRQFLAELDYRREASNLREVYESSLDPESPYAKRGVEVPRAFPELCTGRVITMSYLPGPKFEEEARRQLEALGIDTSRGVQSVVRGESTETNTNANANANSYAGTDSKKSRKPSLPGWLSNSSSEPTNSWAMKFAERVGMFVGVDNILLLVRLARRALLWSRALAVQTIRAASKTAPSVMPVSESWLEWARNHENAASQAEMLNWTSDAIDALFDVHGYQIFHEGLFNADAHPGNILVIQSESGETNKSRAKLGLIDYGQCKRLDPEERKKVARLMLGVANDESDAEIADLCRDIGFVTKNDSTRFLSSFARLMFGKFRSEYLKRDWHKALHDEDEIVYFPNELSMVYRASLLLRGLAMSFQLNVSVGEKWRDHAQALLDRNEPQSRVAGGREN